MKRRVLPRAVLAAILLALPAAADAPSDPPQYERFDGDSVTIVDAFTKLEWDRRAVMTNVGFATASSGCSFLSTLQGTGRLPTVKELLTIVDEDPHVEYEFGKVVTKMIDAPGFPNTPVDLPYWTSTPAGAGKVWTLSFSTGLMTAMSTDAAAPPEAKAHARCVH